MRLKDEETICDPLKLSIEINLGTSHNIGYRPQAPSNL